MEITLKINKRTKAGKAFMAMLEVLLKDAKGIEMVSSELNEAKAESPYNPEFVKKIRRAEKEVERGECTVIDPNDVWGSLGL